MLINNRNFVVNIPALYSIQKCWEEGRIVEGDAFPAFSGYFHCDRREQRDRSHVDVNMEAKRGGEPCVTEYLEVGV